MPRRPRTVAEQSKLDARAKETEASRQLEGQLHRRSRRRYGTNAKKRMKR
jgi:hypothetical protein